MSDFDCLDVRPYQLMCLICRGEEALADPRLAGLLRAIRAEPDRPMRLRATCSGVYRFQNPGRSADTPEGELFNELRDLAVLQRLGLAPGSLRPARELLERILRLIETTDRICGFGAVTSPEWRGCERAPTGAYQAGRQRGLAALITPRPADEMRTVKKASAEEVLTAAALRIRPHHLICMACFNGGRDEMDPIEADNLQEAIVAMRRNPDIPVTLIEGCCMICPPCHSYEPSTGLCVGSCGMSLRDQKKDLDTLQRLGLKYGDTLPARELYRRIFAKIHSTTEICGNGTGKATSQDWTVCGGPDGAPGYVRARATGIGLVPPAGTVERRKEVSSEPGIKQG